MTTAEQPSITYKRPPLAPYQLDALFCPERYAVIKAGRIVSVKCLEGCTCRRHIGHPQSEATRAAISVGHLGKPKSPEHRAKLAAALLGKPGTPASEATKLAVSRAQKGRKRTPEELAKIGAAHRTHGYTHTPTYESWRDMRGRCQYPSNPSYASYGGRGITFCEQWRSFSNFLADMGKRPEGKTLDRMNTDGNYEPSNCRWATPKEQAANRRRTRVVIA